MFGSFPFLLFSFLTVVVASGVHFDGQRFTVVPAPYAKLFRPAVTDIDTEPVVTSDQSTAVQEAAMSAHALLDRWSPYVEEASRRFGIPASWIRAVMRQESGGRTVNADGSPITSPAGAQGLMQLMPETYNEARAAYGLGNDAYDPHDNVIAGASVLRVLYRRYGFPAMFAAYNDGPGNYEASLRGDHELPKETQNYLASISARLGDDQPSAARRRRHRARVARSYQLADAD